MYCICYISLLTGNSIFHSWIKWTGINIYSEDIQYVFGAGLCVIVREEASQKGPQSFSFQKQQRLIPHKWAVWLQVWTTDSFLTSSKQASQRGQKTMLNCVCACAKNSQAKSPDTVCSTYGFLGVRFAFLNPLPCLETFLWKSTMLHCCERRTQPAVEHGI